MNMGQLFVYRFDNAHVDHTLFYYAYVISRVNYGVSLARALHSVRIPLRILAPMTTYDVSGLQVALTAAESAP